MRPTTRSPWPASLLLGALTAGLFVTPTFAAARYQPDTTYLISAKIVIKVGGNVARLVTTLLLGSGASLDDVKRVMGHSSIAIMSDVYSHRVEGRARELAATLNRALA
jgi:integrase